jgi:hypothetical protein
MVAFFVSVIQLFVENRNDTVAVMQQLDDILFPDLGLFINWKETRSYMRRFHSVENLP